MAANNLIVRKGKCINIGGENCKIADTKEIVEVNLGDEFICPECGGMLVEVKKPKKNWILYVGIAVVLIGSILFLTIKSKVEQATDVVKAVDTVITTITDNNKAEGEETNNNPEIIPTTEESQPIPKNEHSTTKPTQESVKKQPKKVEHTQQEEPTSTKKIVTTLHLSFGYYKGETLNGLADGQGIFYFNERHIINPRDPKARYAEAGEYVSGVFYDGYLVNGKLFGKDNQQKVSVIIGQ